MQFSLRFLWSIVRAATLSPQVKLYLQQDRPLLVKYEMGSSGKNNLGEAVFALAPQIDDDDVEGDVLEEVVINDPKVRRFIKDGQRQKGSPEVPEDEDEDETEDLKGHLPPGTTKKPKRKAAPGASAGGRADKKRKKERSVSPSYSAELPDDEAPEEGLDDDRPEWD